MAAKALWVVLPCRTSVQQRLPKLAALAQHRTLNALQNNVDCSVFLFLRTLLASCFELFSCLLTPVLEPLLLERLVYLHSYDKVAVVEDQRCLL